VIQVLLLLLLMGDLVNLVLAPWWGRPGPVARVLTGDVFGPEAWALRRHPELDVDALSVSPRDFSTGETLLYLTGHGLAFSLATIPMLVMARRLVDHARYGDPFRPAMVRRLRVLGFVVLLGGALCEAVEYAASYTLMRISLPGDVLFGASPDVSVTFWWLLPGCVLLAVAEVVRRGCALRAELDEVI